MSPEEEDELRNLLVGFGAHNGREKVPAKRKKKQSQSHSMAQKLKSQVKGDVPQPSSPFMPLTSPAAAPARPETPDLSVQTAAIIAEFIRNSKKEQANRFVLDLIQCPSKHVNWRHEPHVSNLKSVRYVEHMAAVEFLHIWYPNIDGMGLSFVNEQYRNGVRREERRKERGMKRSGTSFDSAICLDDEEEAERTATTEKSIRAKGLYLPSPSQTPSAANPQIRAGRPTTPTQAVPGVQSFDSVTPSTSTVQHSLYYTPKSLPTTPKRPAELRNDPPETPCRKRSIDLVDEDDDLDLRLPRMARYDTPTTVAQREAVFERARHIEKHEEVLQKEYATSGESMLGDYQDNVQRKESSLEESTQLCCPSPAKTPTKSWRLSTAVITFNTPVNRRGPHHLETARTRKRGLIKTDKAIEIPGKMWEGQSEDSPMLKPAAFFRLPRDPLLLAMLAKQSDRRNFAIDVLVDERSVLLAPELRGVLSLDLIKLCGEINCGHGQLDGDCREEVASGLLST